MQISQASSATLDFSIVVPAHNEAENFAPYLEELRTVLEGKGEYEVLCVDDGSTNDTLPRLMTVARRFPPPDHTPPPALRSECGQCHGNGRGEA